MSSSPIARTKAGRRPFTCLYSRWEIPTERAEPETTRLNWSPTGVWLANPTMWLAQALAFGAIWLVAGLHQEPLETHHCPVGLVLGQRGGSPFFPTPASAPEISPPQWAGSWGQEAACDPNLSPTASLKPQATDRPPHHKRLCGLDPGASVRGPSLGSMASGCSCGDFWIPNSSVSLETCWSHPKCHSQTDQNCQPSQVIDQHFLFL